MLSVSVLIFQTRKMRFGVLKEHAHDNTARTWERPPPSPVLLHVELCPWRVKRKSRGMKGTEDAFPAEMFLPGSIEASGTLGIAFALDY